jgi:hypothetical protein
MLLLRTETGRTPPIISRALKNVAEFAFAEEIRGGEDREAGRVQVLGWHERGVTIMQAVTPESL